MRGGWVKRRWRRRLETIFEDEEFLAGPYPEMAPTPFATGMQLVSEWVEQILPCWFGGREGSMCMWIV